MYRPASARAASGSRARREAACQVRATMKRADELRGFLARGCPWAAGPGTARRCRGPRPCRRWTARRRSPARANRRSRNARSLFISGPTACARDAGDISSYQAQKSRQDLVADPGGQAAAVGVVAEQRRDVGEGDLPGAGRDRPEQGQARGAEDVVGAGSPEPGEDPPEDPGDVVDDHVGVGAGPVALQDVQARRGVPGVAGVEQHHLARRVLGEAGEQVGHGVALGVDEHDAAAGLGVGEDLPGDQGGLAGAGRPADPQVVPGVGDRQADRAGRPGVGDAQRADVRAGERDGGRRGDGACPGAGQAGQRRVGGQPGDRGEFRHRQQVAAGEPPGGDHGGGAAQPAAGQPVPAR